MAGLGELSAGAGGLGLGLDVLGLHGRGQETDGDDLSGLHSGDGTRGVTTAGEAHGPLRVLVANEGLANRGKHFFFRTKNKTSVRLLLVPVFDLGIFFFLRVCVFAERVEGEI